MDLHTAAKLTDWMRHIPVLGQLARVFWFLVLYEKDPRDGLIFSFLNDGMRPSLWHTWISIRGVTRWDGIWVGRAPRSHRDAELLEPKLKAMFSRTVLYEDEEGCS